MSVDPYVAFKYGNVEDFMEVLGLSDTEIKNISEERRNRYQNWVLEGQENTEAEVSDLVDVNDGINDLHFEKGSPESRFARNAVMNWALYKKRHKDGSPSKEDAKNDYEKNIALLRKILTKKRTTRVKLVSILGASQKNKNILLPSQLDTAFYSDI